MKVLVCTAVLAGLGANAMSSWAADNSPGQVPASVPSSTTASPNTSGEPGDITLTPENPAPANPLPPLPKLELNTSRQYPPVLPPISPTESSSLYEPEIYVKEYQFTGNHIFSSATLAAQLDKYTGRKITSVELEDARQILSLYYVSRGYINSGALLPDQDPRDGVIHFQIVEGKLTSVIVKDNHWFQSWWLRNEMRQAAGDPLNYDSLKDGIQLLREDPSISQVNAELQPSGPPGESQLEIHVQDKQPFRFSMEINNYRPPSVGSTIAQAHLADLNLTGNDDPLQLTYGVATSDHEGYEFSDLDNLLGDYQFPVSPWRTTMEIAADKNNAGIVEEPFNQLDIQSKLTEYHLSVHQPVFETPQRSFILTFQVDSRRNETSLFGQPFSLSPGAYNGVEDVFVPRFIQEFVDRSQNHVFSFRSQFSYGIDAFHATIDSGPPDGHFFDWLGETQYIQRLGNSDNLIVTRLDGQLADLPLLSLEQLELGGIASVRGYLVNQALRDNGVIASAEVRVPLWMDKDHTPLFSLAPFTDFGLGWNNVEAGPNAAPDSNLGRQGVAMPSAGMGLIFNPDKYFSSQIYWGYGFNRRQVPDGNSLQNQGLEFSVTFTAL